MGPQNQKLSLVEGVVLIFKLIYTIGIAISAACGAFIRYRTTAPPFAVSVFRPTVKYLREGFSKRELIALGMSASTSAGISTYCRRNKLEYTVDRMPNGAAVHWVGKRKTEAGSKLLLYVHGGGYMTPIAPPQISLPIFFASHVPVPTSTAFLEFSLAPDARFPTQIHQIISAFVHILNIYDPSQIILGGESSGSHLILALLSYISHPNPAIYPVAVNLSQSISGAFLISPLVNRGTTAESYMRNASNDFTSGSTIEAARSNWAPKTEQERNVFPRSYLDPLHADDGWWGGLPVDRFLVTAGMWELMQDDCVSFAKRVENETEAAGNRAKVTLVECPYEVHAESIVEETFGFGSGSGGSRMATVAWLQNFTG